MRPSSPAPTPSRLTIRPTLQLGMLLALLLLLPGPARAVVDSLRVEIVGYFPVTDYDPWVADVWGYVDGQGREFALLPTGNKLLVLDCTNPANIIEASSIPSPVSSSDMKDVKTWSHYAYACHESGPVLIVDLQDPYHAQVVGEIPQGDLCSPTPCGFPQDGGSHNLFVDNHGLLQVAGVHYNGTLMYDLAVDPEDPPLVGIFGQGAGGGYVHDVYAEDDTLYTCRGGTGYWDVVDIGDPATPHIISSFTYSGVGYAHSCWITPNKRYILTGDESAGGHLYIWDMTDPESVFPIAQYEAGAGDSSIHNMQVVGSHAYISYYDQGLRVLDISDPENPVEVGWYTDSAWDNGSCSFSIYRGIWGIYALQPSRNLYLSEMCGGGLYVARFLGDTSGAGDAASAGDRIGLTLSPNPARGAVGIEARLEQAGPVRVDVYDARGRHVRSLAAGESRPAGTTSWVWDARDDRGRELAQGLYYVRLAQGRRVLTRKVVRVD